MGKAQIQPYPRGLDFEQVWAELMETKRIANENSLQIKEMDRKIKEITQQKKTDRKTEENVERWQNESNSEINKNAEQPEEDQLKKEIAEENKRLWNKWVGESIYFGDIADYMLLPFLFKKFRKLGLDFTEGRRDYCVSDDVNQIFIGTDFMLRNDGKDMLVKIEKEFTIEDVQDHIKRLEKMRVYADLHGDKRAFLGAVAGVVITPNVKKYALGQGFYVLEPSGETFNIIPPQGKPKEW
jgi:hypothetical protein